MTYDGPSLDPGSAYRWSVRVEDETDGVAIASDWFETTYLSRTTRAGHWITVDERETQPQDPPDFRGLSWRAGLLPAPLLLRKSFHLRAAVARARLLVTARGLYRAQINGARVGADELTPGWTDYRVHQRYQTYDITSLVREGRNAIGVELAHGWWSGYVGFDPRQPAVHYGNSPHLWAQLVVEMIDGEHLQCATDETWNVSTGDRVYADLLIGEYVDRRLDPGAWSSPDFDDASWRPARAVGSDLDHLRSSIEPHVRVVRRLRGRYVASAAHKHIYDFGQNLTGRVRLALPALPKGTRILLRHGEMLDEDGSVYVANLRNAEATDVWISAGLSDTFEPTFTTHGFRFVEISGLEDPLAEDAVSAAVMSNDVEWTGSVETSHDGVNRLLSNIEWSLRGNLVAVPTDCPQRDERLGWLGDAGAFMPTAAFLTDARSFWARWLQDVRATQTEEGAYKDIAPHISTFFPDSAAPGWGDAGVIIPWELYRRWGDRRILADSFDSMRRWVDYVYRNNPDLLWQRRRGNDYGDWLERTPTPRELLATAYWAYSTRLVSHTASELGCPEESAIYAELAEKLARSFEESFVSREGRVGSGSQGGYALAVAFDLIPHELMPSVKKQFDESIAAAGGKLTTGIITTSLLLTALTRAGRTATAYQLLEARDFPSWLYLVEQGATTMWERWDGWTATGGFQNPEMNSFNHYALGGIGRWIFETVGGIQQTESSRGYGQLLITPEPGGTLSSSRARFMSRRGQIATSWNLNGSVFSLEVEVPPTSTATIMLPGWGTGRQVASGVHRFESNLEQPSV
ncbi:family 78 glycoside hydrolase catalytic domain [Microbacterium sp. NPDC057407]|uniref:alpha-L-rhamnosidase n=1 Tax=Microbacterium sp. NPDC057407 TaxID=3346120 RepID=UPI00366DE4F9